MDTLILKIRDLVNDGYQYITEEQEYVTSKIFNLQYANIDSTSLVVQKNGVIWSITPVAGVGVAWSRVGTTVTITKSAHGFITGDTATVTVSSANAALPLGAYTVTKLTADTFTVTGLNAGATSGTCTYTIVANYSYSSTTGKVTVTGNLTAGDKVEFDYNCYSKYSDTELQGYIRSAVYYLTAEQYKTFSVKPPTIIFPTPSEGEESLIAIIAKILMNDGISNYRTPEFTINFNDKDSKETKIKKLITQYKKCYGYMDYVDPKKDVVLDDSQFDN
jgi:hypothetical protein